MEDCLKFDALSNMRGMSVCVLSSYYDFIYFDWALHAMVIINDFIPSTKLD